MWERFISAIRPGMVARVEIVTANGYILYKASADERRTLSGAVPEILNPRWIFPETTEDA
ncbi:MAG TPA: hypothetical protein ENN79_00445 [Desulfobacteraceae bacterium]|nr:hypothetical protein [Desulfobacteraceae bacterium]